MRWIPVNERLPRGRQEVEALVERKAQQNGASEASAPEIHLACFSSLMGVWIQFVDAEPAGEPVVVTHWREATVGERRATLKA